MKKSFYYIAGSASLILAPLFAFADPPKPVNNSIIGNGTGGGLGDFMNTIVGFLSDRVVPFILSIAFLFFVWGVFMYFIKGGHDTEAQETGRSYIISALIGFVVILSFWGVVKLISNGVGFDSTKATELPKPTVQVTPAS
jgi:hypothetical protein